MFHIFLFATITCVRTALYAAQTHTHTYAHANTLTSKGMLETAQ